MCSIALEAETLLTVCVEGTRRSQSYAGYFVMLYCSGHQEHEAIPVEQILSIKPTLTRPNRLAKPMIKRTRGLCILVQ